MSNATAQPVGMFRRSPDDRYVVTCDALELPRGAHFTALPIPVNPGDLALFAISDHLLAGRWYPDAGGADWIQLPDVHIELVGEAKASFQIVGAVVPFEMTAEPSAN